MRNLNTNYCCVALFTHARYTRVGIHECQERRKLFGTVINDRLTSSRCECTAQTELDASKKKIVKDVQLDRKLITHTQTHIGTHRHVWERNQVKRLFIPLASRANTHALSEIHATENQTSDCTCVYAYGILYWIRMTNQHEPHRRTKRTRIGNGVYVSCLQHLYKWQQTILEMESIYSNRRTDKPKLKGWNEKTRPALMYYPYSIPCLCVCARACVSGCVYAMAFLMLEPTCHARSCFACLRSSVFVCASNSLLFVVLLFAFNFMRYIVLHVIHVCIWMYGNMNVWRYTHIYVHVKRVQRRFRLWYAVAVAIIHIHIHGLLCVAARTLRSDTVCHTRIHTHSHIGSLWNGLHKGGKNLNGGGVNASVAFNRFLARHPDVDDVPFCLRYSSAYTRISEGSFFYISRRSGQF